MSRTLVLMLALVTLAAGCLGEDPAPAATAPNAEEDTEATAGTPSAAASVDAAAPIENGTPTMVPISWDGKIGRSFCPPQGPGSCGGPNLPIEGGETFYMVEEKPIALTLEMTWSPATPLTEQLYISAFIITSCGEGCFESSEGSSAMASGGSPLTVEMSGLSLGPDDGVAIHVGTADPSCHSVAVVFTCLNLVEQDFHVEGMLTTVG